MLAFYPAPGYRRAHYGTLYGVGTYGLSWSSSVPAGSNNALYLEFCGSWINPNRLDNRAHGFQLRCLQE
ncbi:MAG: hypothetical protein K2K83_00370 [Rikenella sp.]|nr:hypothetical protein [Rikenella sp.]